MSDEIAEEYIIEENGKLYRVWDPIINEKVIDLGGKEEICRVPFPHPTTEEQQTINKLTIEVWEKEQTIEHFRKQCDSLDGQLWRAEEERDKLKKAVEKYEQKQKDLAGYIKDLQKRTEELLEFAKKLEEKNKNE